MLGFAGIAAHTPPPRSTPGIGGWNEHPRLT